LKRLRRRSSAAALLTPIELASIYTGLREKVIGLNSATVGLKPATVGLKASAALGDPLAELNLGHRRSE
jgi:hypothetical protein